MSGTDRDTAVPAGARVDLTNCDREPIHVPGSIQPHGCLIACDASARTVLRHSANAQGMLSLDGDPNGRLLEAVLGHELAHRLANSLAMALDGRPVALFGLDLPCGTFDVTVHRHKGHTILEFEPASSGLGNTLTTARAVIERLRALQSLDRLIQRGAGLIQALLGYDRVMIYELGADGAGKVVSEAKAGHLESFRGQYFPASDIPRQARALYLKNTIRLIGNSTYSPEPLIPVFDASGEPLDLSYSHLRSVSPVHCEYLRNMGVAASMSISIIVQGQLWGLVACHHYSPKVLSMADRTAAEMVGEFFSLHLDALERQQALSVANAARGALDDLLVDASRSEDIGAALRGRLPKLKEFLPSDGVALWFDGKWTSEGEVPSEAEAAPLLRLAQSTLEGNILATHQISALLPDAKQLTSRASGALVIPLSQRPQDFLFYFRKEAVQTLDWAGDPNKTYASGPLGDRLTPRTSFAIWKETVRDKSLSWSGTDRQFAEAIRLAVVEVLLHNSELLADERQRAEVRQRILNEELNHRVKNILAVIRALVSQKPQEGETLNGYVETLRGRIQALAFAHDQVARDKDGGRLSDLLHAELGPYFATAKNIQIDGPAVALDSRAHSVMALVFHELATNSVKYGSLSRPQGRLDVSWQIEQTGNCTLSWREAGGPPVIPPSRVGFGSTLIERSVPFDLGGTAKIDFERTGLRADFVLPSRHVRPLGDHTSAPELSVTEALADNRVTARRILLVEDQMLIALSLEGDFQDRGFEVIGVAPNVAAALSILERALPDFAVLDVNLGDETSMPIADVLHARNIPFVFATGYGAALVLPEHLRAVPVVSKPYDMNEIVSTLKGLPGGVGK